MSTTFANGGVITLGSVNIVSNSGFVTSVNGFKSSINATVTAVKKLNSTFELMDDPNYCHNRRGGPRSKVFCEVPATVPHDTHTGRGQTGYWFSWKGRDE